jgi:hypothetical protein
MAGRNWLLGGVLATICGSSGCVIEGYEGARLARDAGISCDIPVGQRNLVYVFVLGGNNPIESSALDRFRQGLNAQGYAKVATGPSIFYWWMASEMKRIHREDPNAVFVIAGLDSSASLAVKLSEKVTAEGVPIDAVVIVDPSGKTSGPSNGSKTLVVSAGYGNAAKTDAQSLVITAPGQLGLTGDQRTIDGVVNLLNEIALQNPLPNHEAASAWVYPFATDSPISLDPKPDSEWSFMFDRVGSVTRAIDEPLPPRASTPSTSGTIAGKVSYPTTANSSGH